MCVRLIGGLWARGGKSLGYQGQGEGTGLGNREMGIFVGRGVWDVSVLISLRDWKTDMRFARIEEAWPQRGLVFQRRARRDRLGGIGL